MEKNHDEIQMRVFIHLAGKRGHTFSAGLQSAHTFNEGSYFSNDRVAFGAMRALNDNIVYDSAQMKVCLREHELLMLLPLVGGLEFERTGFAAKFLDVGQAAWIFGRDGDWLSIRNGYAPESINFITAVFSIEKSGPKADSDTSFTLEEARNSLVNISMDKNLLVYAGVFNGRRNGALTIDRGGRKVYAFVIHGAFEVENRLLEGRDGLALSNCETISFEALSDDAVILFFVF